MKIAPAIESSAPDWSTISFHPRCPLCDYDLYGSQTPRCSECGYPFVWSEILDPRLQIHPYLFEHHPENNLWSYWATFKNAFFAKSFWSQLHPAQRPNVRRLIIYWAIGASLFFLSLALLCLLARAGYWVRGSARSRGLTLFQFLGMYLKTGSLALEVGILGVIPLTLPWLYWLTLLIFRVSMRRAKVRSHHVLRSVLYSFDPSSWLFFVSVCYVRPTLAILIDPAIIRGWERDLILCSPILFMVTYRLWMAYRHYLRFDHAFATVFAATTIIALICMNIFYKLTLY